MKVTITQGQINWAAVIIAALTAGALGIVISTLALIALG